MLGMKGEHQHKNNARRTERLIMDMQHSHHQQQEEEQKTSCCKPQYNVEEIKYQSYVFKAIVKETYPKFCKLVLVQSTGIYRIL
jgi:hypothetical protein